MAETTEGTAQLLQEMDRKMKRRTYMRNMMRHYHKERKMEVVYLKNLQDELERDLKQLCSKVRDENRSLSTTTLSWKDVAQALRDDHSRAVSDQEDLKTDVVEIQALARDMQRWVALQTAVPAFPNSDLPTWRHVSLLSHPRSRALGKEWITQHMYHNTDRMFQQYGLPPPGAAHIEFFEFIMDHPSSARAPEDGFEYIHRHQFLSKMPPDVILATYRHRLCALLLVDRHEARPSLQDTLRCEVDGPVAMHQLVTSQSEQINLLSGEFHEATRSVFVAQQIQDDESMGDARRRHPQRNRSLWVEVRPQADGGAVVRVVYLYSQLFHGNKTPCALVDEGKYWDFDATASPPARFRQHAAATASTFLPMAQGRVRSFVESQTIKQEAGTPSSR
ncbi:Aste57867_821 [Aphanomyces stellatus]|uniref:Aste57867_821 protein n=1 Tax=Aphanomyces stellatus TaxID=120398 RepID=A0A485K3K0_9STRA|nr:hypothetical protein As57867_000820 [Aphanomyces stellatus]VFT78045.1 Aste57867_821 [Aphanomyces stellatus]